MTDVRLRTLALGLLWEVLLSGVGIFIVVGACYVDDPFPLPLWVLILMWAVVSAMLCVTWVLKVRFLFLAFEMRRQLAINRRLQRTLAEMRALP